MHKKMLQHMELEKRWAFYKLAKQQRDVASRNVSVYESSHGFGYEDECEEDEFTAFTETDGYMAVFGEYSRRLDDLLECLRRFCEQMAKFTDGEIDYETAKAMATNPRLSKEMERVMFGGRK